MNSKVTEFIEHHGVKGMKWGVRKSGSSVKTGKRGRARTKYEKSPKKLTSDELNKRIKRMEAEKRYNELNRRDIGQGEKIATEILTTVGKNVAITTLTKVGNAAAILATGKAIEKQFGKEMSVALTAGKGKKNK